MIEERGVRRVGGDMMERWVRSGWVGRDGSGEGGRVDGG